MSRDGDRYCEQLADDLQEERARLDYVLMNSCFLQFGKGDAGNQIFMLLTQDDDENIKELSHWHTDIRKCVDEAMEAK